MINICNEENIPNTTTIEAFKEGKDILNDESIKSYTNIEDLKEALEV